MKKVFTAGVLLFFLFVPWARAEQAVDVYHFWGEGCPVCQHSKPFLESVATAHPRVNLKFFEVWRNKDNAALFQQMSRAYGSSTSAVPVTVIGDRIWVGYNPAIAGEITAYVDGCLKGACSDPMRKIGRPPGDGRMVVTAPEALSPGHDVCVHAFFRDDCFQCQRIFSYIDSLGGKYNILLNKYNVSEGNGAIAYERIKEQYQVTPAGFPVVFIGEWFLVGDRAIRENLNTMLEHCARAGCPCPVRSERTATPKMPVPEDVTPEDGSLISVDLFGSARQIDAATTALPLFTLLIAAADSFNPCSFYVLLILLSLITRTGSRKRMLLVGGIFILLSGVIYFLFTAAWLNLWFFMGRVQFITTIAGIIAVIVALISIKDFFFFKKGISLGIPDSAKPKIFERMRGLLESPSLPAVVIGTVVLGVLVNLYELLCTPGFPLVYTRVLALKDLSTSQYYMYLVFYNLIYITPLLIILLVFTLTFGQKKLSEEQGRILKLISGLMMLFLGLALMINPKWLENFLISAGMLAVAVVLGILIIIVTNYLKRRLIKKEKITFKENS